VTLGKGLGGGRECVCVNVCDCVCLRVCKMCVIVCARGGRVSARVSGSCMLVCY